MSERVADASVVDRLLALAVRIGVAKAGRYVAATVVITGLGQGLLYALYAVYGMAAVWANLVAFLVLVGPQYVLNRRWVWGVRGSSSLSREVVPFWILQGAGLAASSVAVAIAARVFANPLWVNAASLTAFGIVWLARLLLLERYVFGGRTPQRH